MSIPHQAAVSTFHWDGFVFSIEAGHAQAVRRLLSWRSLGGLILTDAIPGVVETTFVVDKQAAMLTFPFGHQIELSLLQQIIHPAQPCWRSVYNTLAGLDCQNSSWQSTSNFRSHFCDHAGPL